MCTTLWFLSMSSGVAAVFSLMLSIFCASAVSLPSIWSNCAESRRFAFAFSSCATSTRLLCCVSSDKRAWEPQLMSLAFIVWRMGYIRTNTNYSTSCVLGYCIFHTGLCRDDLWQQFNIHNWNNDGDSTTLSEVAPNTVSSLCSLCSKSATRETCIRWACSGRYVSSYVTVPLCAAGWVFIFPNFWDAVPLNLIFSSWVNNLL